MKIEHIAMYVKDLEGAKLEIMNKPDMEDTFRNEHFNCNRLL